MPGVRAREEDDRPRGLRGPDQRQNIGGGVMAANIRGRLARLERDRHRSDRGRCGACGWSETGPVTFDIPMPRLIGDPPDAGDDPSMDTCRLCGRRLVFRLASPREVAPAGELRLERGR